MALQRRPRKFRIGFNPGFLAVVALLVTFLPAPLGAAVTERVVNDRNTGLAIFGYDPVAYFTDSRPVAGKADYELSFGDVVWRFRSAGNRAAFSAHPEIYQPRYGGYDPVSIARGVAVPGNPLLWLVVEERLYLFYTEAARDEFAASPDTAMSAADGRWQEVRQELSN
jgi:hypothetical protein